MISNLAVSLQTDRSLFPSIYEAGTEPELSLAAETAPRIAEFIVKKIEAFAVPDCRHHRDHCRWHPLMASKNVMLSALPNPWVT